MLRIIKEVEPSKPSTKLSGSGTLPSIAANRHTEPAKLSQMVRGELDWIVMKCLEKDRSRRYETANQLGMEIQRYLTDEPVLAGPPSAGYRVRKFLQRNRGRAIAVCLLLLAVLGGIAAVVWVQVRANHELEAKNKDLEAANERERQRFSLAVDAIGLLTGNIGQDLLLQQKEFEGLRTRLLKGAADFYGKLETQLKDRNDPASRAALGRAYFELGELTDQIGSKEEALAIHRKALAIRRALAATAGANVETRLDVARSLFRWAGCIMTRAMCRASSRPSRSNSQSPWHWRQNLRRMRSVAFWPRAT